ncbi:biotin transporter BioY [Anaerocolumna sp. AGMB13025]|uniref:biotin transporter BioY n=1 Tax=Anaerocolumna sp. AGMB13025 TaxID=3039116 RepID=UPI00241CD0F1|nr:biotin transporter BioY [Anaerocolumna sp. AGMB13025]WFR56958.1 biotin transporter BioY [Anaerocolumna sp. AGMB13025]
MNTKKITTKELTLIGLMTAITCILGPLSIPLPFSVVPITFTNLAIYFTVFLLGWKKGTISYLIYLLIGFVGVPVFSGFSGGPGKLMGPTGGYLIGFILLAVISGLFIEKFKGKLYMYTLGMVLGLLTTYLLGTAWLSFQLELSFQQGLLMGVIPYIPGDILKIAAALLLGPVLRKHIAGIVG